LIASLKGKIIQKGINSLILDVRGVGYGVAVSLYTLEALGDAPETFLYIHTLLRENLLELYGFATSEEKTFFELLLKVAGIGPKTAINVFSGVTPDEFRHAVLAEDLHKLTTIPGIGKKTADRIILELKDKMYKSAPVSVTKTVETSSLQSFEQDLVSSLVNLGYKERQAVTVAKEVMKNSEPGMTLPLAIKAALKELMK
jgi:holliday junction DNA helicase RuvA